VFRALLQRTQQLGQVSRLFSEESLTKKAYLNGLAAALDYGGRLLVGFVITPVLVAKLGDDTYGAWQVLQRLVGYLSPASGRPTQALKWTLAQQQGSTDYERKRLFVGSTVAVWTLFLPLMAVLGVLITWFAPYWLKASVESFRVLRLTTGILVVDLALSAWVAIPEAALEGENLGYKRMGLSALLILMGGGLTWLALYLGMGLVGVAAVVLVIALLRGLLLLQVARACAPWFGLAWPRWEAVWRFLGLSLWFLGWHLIMRVMTASDVVLLGLLDSTELVTTFTLSKYALEALISVVAMMVVGTMPGLGGIIGSGDLQRAARVRNEILSLVWLVVTVMASTILMWNRSFLQLWVGERYYAGSLPSLLIAVVVMQFVVIRNDASIIDLTLDLRRKVLLGFLSITLSLGLAGLLVGRFEMGIVGLTLGLIVGRLVLSLAYPLLVGRFLGIAPQSQLKGVIRPACVTAALFGLASQGGDSLVTSARLTGSAWFDLAISVGLTLAVMLAVASYIGLSGGQRRRILSRIRMAIAISSTGR
jgi:O-antigen/teichoic acid export membrane protein